MIIACAGPITLIANFGGWCYRRYNDAHKCSIGEENAE